MYQGLINNLTQDLNLQLIFSAFIEWYVFPLGPHHPIVLGAIVGRIVGAFAPVITKLILKGTALELVETHVYGFGGFGDNDVGGDANSGGVVGMESIFWLRPSHFDGGLANQDNDFGCDKKRSEFRLCGGGHDKLDDQSKSKNSMD